MTQGAMRRYVVNLDLSPRRVFGLPDGDYVVSPKGVENHSYFTFWTGVDVHRSSRYRSPEDRLEAAFSINGISFTVDDGHLSAETYAADPKSAFALVEWEVRQLLSLLTTFSTNSRLTYQLIGMTEDGKPLMMAPQWEVKGSAYELQELRKHFIDAAALLDGWSTDSRIGQACHYFEVGCDLWENTFAQEDLLLAPLAFLQFWKSVATIAGDPSADHDHQRRCKELGLGRRFFTQQVQPLHDVRNSRGVAHITSLSAPLTVTAEDVLNCREVATHLIQAYLRSPKELRDQWNQTVTSSPRALSDRNFATKRPPIS